MKIKHGNLRPVSGIPETGLTKSGFTLVELLIAVTLSAILMTSVIIFTGSIISNSTKNEKVLTNFNKNTVFEDKLIETIEDIDSKGIFNSGSSFGEYSTGIFLSTKGPNFPITFIGEKTFTGYCDAFSGAENATGTINKLVIKEMIGTYSHSGTTSYYIDFQNNTIRKKSDKSVIIGTGYRGDNLDYNNPLNTELNNPSAIIENGAILFIADSGNNRILGLSGNKVYEILREKDGIINPTDIYYNGGLFIANAGNGNIIKIADGKGSGDKLDIPFKAPKNISFDTMDFTFDGIESTTGPTSDSDFNFNGFSKGSDNIIIQGAKLEYYLSGETRTLSGGNTYGIKINNISNPSSNPGSYSVKIDFYTSGSTNKETLYSPYFTKGDGNILTKTGNVIEILTGGLNYPNNITSISNWDLTISDYNNLLSNSFDIETISELPVKDFSYSVTGNILNLKVNYYKYYDCLNEKHIIEEKTYKKYIN